MLNIISSSRYKIDRERIQKEVEKILLDYSMSPYTELNVVFVGKKKMLQVSKKYKGEDVALPVLSFLYNEHNIAENQKVIGEVIICYPQAVLLAAEREKKVDQIISYLVEHGVRNILK